MQNTAPIAAPIRKLAEEIQVGDRFREHSHAPIYTVAEILSPMTTGSWQSCRGTGFPRFRTTNGDVRMLAYGFDYAVWPKEG